MHQSASPDMLLAGRTGSRVQWLTSLTGAGMNVLIHCPRADFATAGIHIAVMGKLDGMVAVITGGTRGIGRATAEMFAAEGARLALCARGQAGIEETQRDLKARYGTESWGRAIDILDPAGLHAFVHESGERFGKLDILVNNAGGSEQRAAQGSRKQVYAVDPIDSDLPPGRFESMSDEEFLNAFDQKVLALVRATRAALPWMRKAGGGSIVNIVSMKGKQPPPRVVSSGVAAAAAMNLSKALSLELAAENIRVNVVALESIVTSQTEKSRARWAPDKTMEEFLAPRNANIPMHRLGSAEEVAHAILCFAAPLGAYITGQVLCVDGGGLRSW
ncbi:MAG: SDR family NAD(P)-dependent oxidoreductase [Burkholderiales bacterium]